MKIGDLVKYRGIGQEHDDAELGIITATGQHPNGQPECHVIWYTCNNEGWWDSKNLEVVSENR